MSASNRSSRASSNTPLQGQTNSTTAGVPSQIQIASVPQSPTTRRNTQASSALVQNPPTAQSPTTASATAPTNPSQVPARPATGRRRSSGRPKNFFQRLHSAFSPSVHDLPEKTAIPHDTSRPYLHKQQRFRLQRKSWTEFFITLVLCVAYFLILFLYQHNQAIDKRHRRIINALVTGVVLLLGVNLNNSLRSYAKMMRWRFLASGYRNLKEFDLLMGCDSIMNVVSLLRHGRHKDKKFPFNSKVQFYALLWMMVQLGIVLAVGVIGLTYNLDISPDYVNTQTGLTSSINFTTLFSGNYLSDLAGLQTWGIRGTALLPAPESTLQQSNAPEGSFLTDYQGNSRRFFVDYNPDDYQLDAVSDRYIDSSVVCKQFRVTDGEYGDLGYFTYDVDGRAVNETLYESPGPSGLYVTANGNDTTSCGERCTRVVLFQARSLDDDYFSDVYIDHALRFECNNTVSNVQDLYGRIANIYNISPLLSRMLAGMLAWSSTPPNGTNEYQLYFENIEFGWPTTPTEFQVAHNVSAWTIAGVAAMDARDGSTTESGLERMFVEDGDQPVQAQVLDVKWWAAGAILGAIPFVQFWTLIIVIFFANKVIIKDDNPIAVAKVYHSLLNKIGDHHGCMLTGDQLMETLEDEHGVTKVIFGTKDGADGIRHVDIFEEGSGINPPRVFPEGDYDGVGRENGGRRRPKKAFNARDYF